MKTIITPTGLIEEPLTQVEIDAKEEIRIKSEQDVLDSIAKNEQIKADRLNGNQKLLDLGLTQAEATALTGYTPPSED
jgi:hypothetical protein